MKGSTQQFNATVPAVPQYNVEDAIQCILEETLLSEDLVMQVMSAWWDNENQFIEESHGNPIEPIQLLKPFLPSTIKEEDIKAIMVADENYMRFAGIIVD